MGKIIPIEMGMLTPSTMQLSIGAYDDAIETISAVWPMTDAMRCDVALAVVELAERGVRDPIVLKAAALNCAWSLINGESAPRSQVN